MARLVGIDLPRNKKMLWALTYIYGIGLTGSKKILAATGVDPDKRTDVLTDDDIARLKDEIEKNHLVEGDLRREIAMNISRLKDINCYRGSRHRKNLPVRGQRTRTNNRTRRGGKRIAVGKKKAS